MKALRHRIFGADALHDAWYSFRSDFKKAPSSGVDGVDFRSFDLAARSQTAQLAEEISAGTYRHGALRASFIRKNGGAKQRCINIPNIRDRLVQRVILKYIRDRFDAELRRLSGFGVLKQASVEDALVLVEKHLPSARWVLRLDIQAFFDSIDRVAVEERVRRFIRAKSLEFLAVQPINVETQLEGTDQREAFRKAGMRHGVGLRQGQPLSPLYALLFLHPLDSSLNQRNIKFVRYVDDILVFCESKAAADGIRADIDRLLNGIGLAISPDQSKSFVCHANDRFEFLGFAIERSGGRVLRYLPKGLIGDVDAVISSKSSAIIADDRPGAFLRFAAYLRSIEASYESSYRKCQDWSSLAACLAEASRREIRKSIGSLHSALNGAGEQRTKAYRALGIK